MEHTLSCATGFSNSQMTMKKALERRKRIPINIFYKENWPVYLDGLPHLAGESLVAQKIEPNVKGIIEELKLKFILRCYDTSFMSSPQQTRVPGPASTTCTLFPQISQKYTSPVFVTFFTSFFFSRIHLRY